MWLTQRQLRDLRVARDAFFFSSWKLARLGAEVGTRYYKRLPKHHMIDHCGRSCQATSWNPGSYWTFSDEDNMGFMSTIFHSYHGSSLNNTGLERWIVQFCTQPGDA